jgi:hypothetical protein
VESKNAICANNICVKKVCFANRLYRVFETLKSHESVARWHGCGKASGRAEFNSQMAQYFFLAFDFDSFSRGMYI